MFLKMTPQEVVKRRRIQHWLLMLMRCALLGLLAFAFSRPFIPKDQIPFVSAREDQSVVLLIDNSFSMQYAENDGQALIENAKDAALSSLSSAAGEDEFSVIAFSDRTAQLTPFDTDLAVHRNAIEGLIEASYRTTDFYTAIRLAEDVLSEARNQSKRIILFSDIQQSGWQGAFENWKLNADIDFEIVNVGVDGAENSFVDGFSLLERRVEGRVVHRFNARLGATEEDEIPLSTVELQIAGSTVDEQRVGGGELQRASFQYRAPREGDFTGSIRLEEDNLSLDNVYYFSFSVDNKPALLGVGGNERDISRASYYLSRAFNQGDQALYDFNIPGSNAVNPGVLRNQQVVFLSPASLSGSEISALQRYVEEGGSVVVSFEESVDVSSYNRFFADLGVGEVSEIVRARTEQGYDAIIGEVDLKHPVFSVFAESGSGSIFRPKFRQYARLAPDSTASVLARYDSGDPFLVEKEVGLGRVLVYTSSLSPTWTDFIINEMYIPFLYQLVKYSLAANSVRQAYVIGESVRLEGRPGEEWDVRGPGNNLYKVPIDEGGQGFFQETEFPGHYSAALGSEQVLFSVNVDPREAVLTGRDPAEAYGAVVPPPDDVPITVEEARLVEIDDEERQQKFWRYVILLIVLLYALETFVANRITQ